MKQRPLHTIMKRKQLATKVPQIARSEQKVISSEPKLIKGPIKTSAVIESSAARKPEPKKIEKEKAPIVPTPTPVESSHGGHYELNEKMTRMVETELQDIMIKVWQELPDHPTGEAECLVVDKLRNQAGDHLRNVLGLNITKRLLNVHNPLYVKVQFSGKPEKVHLGEFLKKYNFNAFKRIEKTVNMFAAQIRTIADFDKICSDKDIRCGNIKVTVNPIYTFTKCPPNLVTSFSDKTDVGNDEISTELQKDVNIDKLDVSNIISPEKNVPQKLKAEASKVESVDKDKEVVATKTVDNKTTTNKPTVENKTTVNKPAAENKTTVNKLTVNKPTVENKPVVKKPAVENKPAAENKIPVKRPVENTAPSKLAENKALAKPSVSNNTTVSKPLENKEIKKPIQVSAKNINANSATTPVKTQTPVKPVAKTAVKQVYEPAKKTKKVESDYDELDDYDILALMSEGIVLDECSGSDDE